jgi:hypothetical protein
MVDSLSIVAFAQLLSHQSAHHDLYPLLSDNGILRSLQCLVVLVVDSVECGRHLGLLGQESLGLGSRHCGEQYEMPDLEIQSIDLLLRDGEQVVCWASG